MEKARVILADENKGFGGAERHVVTLGRALYAQSSLIALAARTNSWLAENCQGIPFHPVGFRNEVDMLSVYNLYRKFKSEKINVVHCIGHRDFVAASLARNLPGAPKVAVVKAEHSYPDKNLSPLFRWAYGQCQAITTVSSSLKEAITEAIKLKPGVRLEIIPNGIEVPNSSPAPLEETPIHIGVLSPLRPGKGHSDFLQAAAKLPTLVDRPLRFSFAGEGELKAQLEQEAGDLGLTVEFLGHIDEPTSYLNSLHLSVVPSHRETFSLVTLESMMSGLPLVAADSEGVEELCSGHSGAKLYPVGQIDALAKAMSDFLSNPQPLTEGARANLDSVRGKYSSAAMASCYVALYTELLS